MDAGGDWMACREQAWVATKSTSANEHATLQTININIEHLRSYAQTNDKLRGALMEFCSEHKLAEEEWEACVRSGSPTAELRTQFKTKVLMLMCSFAGRVLLNLHLKNTQFHGSTHVPPLHSNVDEINDAEAVHYAMTIIAEAVAVCCSSSSTTQLQTFLLEHDVIKTVVAMYNIPRQVELMRYGEGYRTSLMRILANVTFGNTTVSAYLLEHSFIAAILSATKIDEENAGLREWAEFCIRNIAGHPPVVAYIKELKAQRVSSETDREMARGGLRVTNPENPTISNLNGMPQDRRGVKMQ
ncbi:hypothetical protein DIPPA_22625 [Diplonema papillatum]|nr:hypothetical protein DIPPA_22625 [Diplonema papillatum]